MVAPAGNTSDHEAADPGEPLFRRMADALPTGLVQIDPGYGVVFANRRLEAVLGIAAEDLTLDRLLAPFGADDRQLLRLALDRALCLHGDDELEVDARVGGSSVRCAVTMVPVTDQDGTTNALVTVNDITRSAGLRDELRARATFDALTGCHNRGSAMAALDMALVDTSAAIGVLFIDLDRFKPVNDRLGHAVGDELLLAVANRLRVVCRASDVVGRLGGDEFIVVCRDLHQDTDEALSIAERVHLALLHPFPLRDHTVEVGASIGVAYGTAGMTAEDVLALADEAMYKAKRDGNGPVLNTDRSRRTQRA